MPKLMDALMLWIEHPKCELREVWQWYNGWRSVLPGTDEEWWYVICMLINKKLESNKN